MNWAVYIITNKVNDKNYVGITCERTKTILDRFNAHIELAYSGGRITRHGRQFPIYAAILKYGAENFSVRCLESNLCLYEAQDKEIEYIEQYDSLVPNGYNLKTGGANGKDSDETKQRKSISRLGKNTL